MALYESCNGVNLFLPTVLTQSGAQANTGMLSNSF